MNEEILFAEASAIESPEERRKFLDNACGDNHELRSAVEKLLRLAADAGSFLEHPPVKASAVTMKGTDATVVCGDNYDDDDSAGLPGLDHMHLNQPDDEILLGYLEPATRDGSLGRLGHYEVLEVIGRGAFGTVLRAFDEKLERIVAIKVLAPEMAATSPARKRFLREAKTSAQIRHENVVSIYSVEEEPIPYLVMEYIPGKTLQQRLEEKGPLELPDVLRLGKQIADGLAAAHAQGLIHRDIKPGNILLEGGLDERVKITDFGLARTADDASMTQSGVIAGTPMYMAPEQAYGHKLDQRADLFSFGSVLYQMVSGRPPFRAPTTMAVLKRVTEDNPRPIQEIIPEAPDWICQIITRLHAKNPDSRYNSAKEVSELLALCAFEFQAGRTPTLPGPSSKSGDKISTAPSVASSSSSTHVQSDSRLQSPWLKLAVAALLGLGLFGLTEVTGVTRVVATLRGVPAAIAPSDAPTGNNEWIDVVALIDPLKDKFDLPWTGSNPWRVEQGELVIEKDPKASKLILPLDIDSRGLEMELDFTQRSGDTGFIVNIPHASGDFPIVFDPPGTKGISLGKRGQSEVLSDASMMEIGQRTRIRIELREQHGSDQIVIQRNDAPATRWIGNRDEIPGYADEGYPHHRRLSLFTFPGGGDIVFHRIRVRALDGGTVTPLRPAREYQPLAAAAAPPPAIAPFDAAQAKSHQETWAQYLGVPVEYENSIGMKFRLIPPGEFLMGSTPQEIEAAIAAVDAAQPWREKIESEVQHKVVLSRPLYVATTEVTQAQYEKVMGTNPSHFSAGGEGRNVVADLNAGSHPVESVNWHRAVEFCVKLSQQEALKPFSFTAGRDVMLQSGTGYRLPTEAEWEFACRAGSSSRFFSGDRKDDLLPFGWFQQNADGRTHTVAELKANPFGLYDMHGNVAEWVQDGWDPTFYGMFASQAAVDPISPFGEHSQRILRGGDWYGNASNLRAAARAVEDPVHGECFFGFRVVLHVDVPQPQQSSSSTPNRLQRLSIPAGYTGVPPQPITAPLACYPRCYSPDGKWLVTHDHLQTNTDEALRVWEIATGKLHATLTTTLGIGEQFPAFSPDGARLAYLDVEAGQPRVTVLNTESFQVHTRWQLPSQTAHRCAFDRTGKILATTSKNLIALWNVDTGEEMHRWTDIEEPEAIAFSPTGGVLAVENAYRFERREGGRWGLDSKIVLIDINPLSPTYNQRLHTWDAPDNGYGDSLIFTPDGSQLIFARSDGSKLGVAVADVKTGEVLHEMTPEGEFKHLVFARPGTVSPDGKTLLTLRMDMQDMILVWDLATGKLVRSHNIPSVGGGASIAADPTGKILAIGGALTSELLFYETSTGERQLTSTNPR